VENGARITGVQRLCGGVRGDIVRKDNGHDISLGWTVTYQYRAASAVTHPGCSVFNIADGVIVAMRDECDDREMESIAAWSTPRCC